MLLFLLLFLVLTRVVGGLCVRVGLFGRWSICCFGSPCARGGYALLVGDVSGVRGGLSTPAGSWCSPGVLAVLLPVSSLFFLLCSVLCCARTPCPVFLITALRRHGRKVVMVQRRTEGWPLSSSLRFNRHHQSKHSTCEVHFRALPEPINGHPMVQIEVVT